MNDLLIFNGRVLAETHTLPVGYVLVRGGRIASIGTEWKGLDEAASAERIDARGLAICPGLIDMHTHGIQDVNFVEGGVEEMVRGLSIYATFGITRVLPSTVANPYDHLIGQIKLLRKVGEDRQYGDIMHGVHLEGPWLAPRCRGGHDLRFLRTPDRPDVERILGEVGDVIKTVTFAPELPGSVWLTEQLSRRRIVPVLGHTEATYEEAEAVILAGARHVTHMYDTTLGYKENPNEALVMMPGMETAVLAHDEVSIELIGCPVHVPRPFFAFIDRVKPARKKVIVSDSLVGAGMKDGTVLTTGGREMYVEQGVLRMINEDPKIDGNLTGSAVTLNVGLRRLLEFARLPLEEAIRWVSLNPATTLGVDHETGSIAVGKLADLVLMDDNCDVKWTFVKGREVFRAV
jgi:N-acetylglucosamine-6-phosphate deacetylase